MRLRRIGRSRAVPAGASDSRVLHDIYTCGILPTEGGRRESLPIASQQTHRGTRRGVVPEMRWRLSHEDDHRTLYAMRLRTPAARGGVLPVRAQALRAAARTPAHGSGQLRALLRDPLRLALVGSIIVGISRIHQHFGIIGALRPALLLFVFAMGCVVLVPSSVDWRLAGRTWPARGVLALAAIACLSAVFGLSLGGSALFILDIYSRVILIFVVMVAATRGVSDVRLWTWAFVISVLILLWMAFFVMDTFTAHGQTMIRIQNDYMYDGNDLGVLLIGAVPLALLLLQTAGRWARWLAIPVLAGVPAAVAMTGSRGGLVGLIVLVVGLLVFATHVALWRRLVLGGAVAVTVMIAAPAGYWDVMGTLLHLEEDYNMTEDAGRKQIWIRGLGYMAEYPIFGVGVNNFTRAETTISPLARNPVPGARVPMHAPHNTFLQAAAEMGIFALLIWVSFFWVAIVKLPRMRKRLPAHWARGSPDERFLYLATIYLPVAFLVVAATTSFVSHLYLPAMYILLAILGGVLLEIERRSPPAPGVRRHGSLAARRSARG
jgi:O-antigen ligase